MKPHRPPMGPPPPPPPVSDIRLKTNVQRIGTATHGLPLYAFNYLDEDEEGRYVGVMAQDVLNVMPAAVVVGEDGYYRVNYEMLGIDFRRIA